MARIALKAARVRSHLVIRGQRAVHGAGLVTALPDVGLLSALKKDSPTEPVPSTDGHLLLPWLPVSEKAKLALSQGYLLRH